MESLLAGFYHTLPPRSAEEIANDDKAKLGAEITARGEFTYGEVIYDSFLSLLKFLEPKEGDVFWDLGCGGAKPVAVAALNFPFKSCKGVEFLPQLAQAAKNQMHSMK